MSRYTHGRRVRQDDRIRSIKRRGLWAFRMAGAKAKIARGIRWRFWEWMKQDKCPLHGSCDHKPHVTYIDITVDRGIESTVCHELAHAAQMWSQGDYDAEGHRLDDHDEIWVAWQRKIRRYYFRHDGGPNVKA